MKIVEDGKTVQVHYTGSLANGEIFDTSRDHEPLSVTIGQGNLIDGFETALMGMKIHEKKVVTLSPEEAYGFRDEKAMRKYNRNDFQGSDVEVGEYVTLKTSDGDQIPVKVVQIDDQSITLDMNHPLAGKTLTFELEVIAIQ